jgi:hypothetical protein
VTGFWDSDEHLLADLAEAVLAARDVPPRLVDAGKAAFAWHTVDAELAALAFDSAVEPAGTRAETATLRAMTFVASHATIEVEVTSDALLGQVAPPRSGEILVRQADGLVRTVPVDALGWFTVRPRPTGMFRLELTQPTGPRVLTAWTTL